MEDEERNRSSSLLIGPSTNPFDSHSQQHHQPGSHKSPEEEGEEEYEEEQSIGSSPSLPRRLKLMTGVGAGVSSSSSSIIGSLLRVDSLNDVVGAPMLRRIWTEGVVGSRPAEGQRVNVGYPDRSMIDWAHEDRKERERLESLRLGTGGISRMVSSLYEIGWPWLGIILIGSAVGLVAGTLDVLAEWLSDLREGRCGYAFYLSKNGCCSGLEPNEICYEWNTWSEVIGVSSAPIVAFIRYLLYILISVFFAGSAAILVKSLAPFAFHTGIPEIKVILSGYVFEHYLSTWTLIIKAIGLAFAVAALPIGKEGPLVHVACCVANIVLQPFKPFRINEARKREMLVAASAAGVSVAFGAPLGGVLFVLEEMSLSSLPQTTLWRAFVCAIVATMTLQSLDPFKSGKVILFQVQNVHQVWRAFELVPWIFLGLFGGLFGACFIRANMEYAQIRRSSSILNHPIREVLAVAGFTSICSYLLVITRVPTFQLVEALFADCSSSKTDPFLLCDSTHVKSTVIILVIFTLARSVITSITFGIHIPAGIFLPTIGIGAAFGRAVGITMNAWQQAYPRMWLFGACPPEGSCISPQVYAVIGAASAVGGLTRMTISLVVIIFELTGAVELVLQIMMAVMISKFTADYFCRDGIYEAWIHFRGYPYLSPKEDFKGEDVTANEVMIKKLISLPARGWTLETLEREVQKHQYKGFPIIDSKENNMLLGYIPTHELKFALAQARSRTEEYDSKTKCQFFNDQDIKLKNRKSSKPNKNLKDQLLNEDQLKKNQSKLINQKLMFKENHDSEEDLKFNIIDLNKWVDEAPLTLDPETPMQVVLQYFQRLGLRNMLFTSHGILMGILTINDLHKYIQAPFYSNRTFNEINHDEDDDRNEMRTNIVFEQQEHQVIEEEYELESSLNK